MFKRCMALRHKKRTVYYACHRSSAQILDNSNRGASQQTSAIRNDDMIDLYMGQTSQKFHYNPLRTSNAVISAASFPFVNKAGFSTQVKMDEEDS